MRVKDSLLHTVVICCVLLTMVSLSKIFVYGLEYKELAKLVMYAGGAGFSAIGNRKTLYYWIGFSFILSAFFSVTIPSFYIILLFFIDISKNKTEYIFSFYVFISMMVGMIYRISTVFMLENVILICGVFVLFLNNKKSKKCVILSLTEDEENILSQLITGKQQKEIKEWNKNTVSKKLKQARERNGLLSNAELILMYREKSGLFLSNADRSQI